MITRLKSGNDIELFKTKFNNKAEAQFTVKKTKQLSARQNIHLLYVNGDSNEKDSFLNTLKSQPEVVSASFNAPVQFRDSIPNDELFTDQWDMERIGAPKVWEYSTGGTSFHGHEIVVAVLDKGFDLLHPDLFDNYWVNEFEVPNDGEDNDNNGYVDDVRGWNFRQNSPMFSVERHGTSVNGIIGAKGNNGIGTAGLNWNIKIMPLAIEYVDEVISAFDYVLEMRRRFNESNGADGAFIVVTNGSFGIDGLMCSEYPEWGSMYDPLGQEGVLNVAATANQDWNIDEVGDIPTSCESDYMIAVTNTDMADNRVKGAGFGIVNIDLGAPGQGTSTTNLGESYRNDFSGTSSACPHVSGAIALLYSLPCSKLDSLALIAPGETALMMRKAILENVEKIPSLSDETASGGRLDVFESMKYLHAYCIATATEVTEGDFKEEYLGKKGFIKVSPSPTTDFINIEYSNADFRPVKIRVFNMLGQTMIFEQDIQPEPFAPQKLKIDVSDWATGVYVLNMFDLSEKISVKFMKF
ncbi:MAG: S8 family peptidase [Saprospiraceae bacterium]|nr:S8 family peptidase [Saprospiraceae bacterium]